MSGPVVQGVVCQVCLKQRIVGDIHPRESKLLKGITVLICSKCEMAKKEPRAFIIIVAREQGIKAVREYINQYRYEGKPIEAKEIINIAF